MEEHTRRTTLDLGIPGYRGEGEIGRGGFAVVHRATRVALRQTVAVKLLLDADKDPLVLARFERELAALGTLAHHPHIVTIYDGGTTAHDAPYLAMEFVRDGSLADKIRRDGPMSTSQVLDCGVKLAGALETAHRAGVLHRDVKPENVLISSYAQPLLADFGIAQIQGGSRTRSGIVTASIAHAAPEIINGAPASPQADVYALGSTLFMLLTGTPPFRQGTDESIVPMLARVLNAPVPDLRGRGVPPDVCALLERAMAKDPGRRPPSALAFAHALREVQRSLGLAPTEIPVEGGTAAAPPPWRPPAVEPAHHVVEGADEPDVVPPLHRISPWASASVWVAALGFVFIAMAALASGAGGSSPQATVGTVLLRSGTVLAGIGQLLAAVLVIVWLHRARTNTDALVLAPHRLGSAWAVAGWFVPLANLVLPVIVVTDVVRACSPQRDTIPHVAFWWAGWIGGAVSLPVGAAVVNYSATAPFEITTLAPFLFVAAFFYVGSAAAFTGLASRLARWQDELVEDA